jgi:hypothetical protein
MIVLLILIFLNTFYYIKHLAAACFRAKILPLRKIRGFMVNTNYGELCKLHEFSFIRLTRIMANCANYTNSLHNFDKRHVYICLKKIRVIRKIRPNSCKIRLKGDPSV